MDTRTTRGADRVVVYSDVHVFVARQAVRGCAESIGFKRIDCLELLIAGSELASNIVKYGIRGEIIVEPVLDPEHGVGICIMAKDVGPAFYDLETALRDGHGDRGPVDPVHLLRRGGLGSGLGAVIRFTDSFRCDPEPVGKTITVVRFLHRPSARNSHRGYGQT